MPFAKIKQRLRHCRPRCFFKRLHRPSPDPFRNISGAVPEVLLCVGPYHLGWSQIMGSADILENSESEILCSGRLWIGSLWRYGYGGGDSIIRCRN